MKTFPPNRHLLSERYQDTCPSFLKQLRKIYAAMDLKYTEAAKYYGFHCEGCEDNCCFTRFYHHTLLEYLYMFEGFKTFDREKQDEVKQRASDVCRETVLADKKGQTVRLMCPLNSDGLCLLYDFRPMICRLHGIPHELKQTGIGVVQGPGCEAFSKQCPQKGYFTFDRTPFYMEMANLERNLKQAVGMTQKLKFTVAQMINTFVDR